MAAGALALVPSLAQADTYGYAGSDLPIGIDCVAAQPCTYFSDGGAQWVVPVSGTIDGFSVDHTAGAGTQQVALLLLRHADGTSTWTVDTETGLAPLSDTAGTESFSIPGGLSAPAGDTLAVTVVPDSSDTAEGVLVNTSGSGGQSTACEEGNPAAGGSFSDGSPCSLGHADYAVGVSVQMAGSSTPPSGGGSTGSGGTGGSGSTGGSGGTGGSGSTISTYQAHQIAVYKAAKIRFYRATIIKRLPPAPPIRKLRAENWGIPVPAHCYTACVTVGTLFGFELGALLYDGAADLAGPAAARRKVVIGHVRMTGKGNLRPKLIVSRAYRRALLRFRRPVHLTVVETVTDRKYGFVKRRTQRLVLRP